MRCICLDLGTRRIGVAASEDTGLLAFPVGIIQVKSKKQVTAEVLDFITRYEAQQLVIGLPLRMNGNSGPEAEQARQFAADLAKHTPLPIDFMDERLTSVEAQRMVDEGTTRRRKKKKPAYIDDLAAAIILQTYLDSRKSQRPLLP